MQYNHISLGSGSGSVFFHQLDPDPSNMDPDPQHWKIPKTFTIIKNAKDLIFLRCPVHEVLCLVQLGDHDVVLKVVGQVAVAGLPHLSHQRLQQGHCDLKRQFFQSQFYQLKRFNKILWIFEARQHFTFKFSPWYEHSWSMKNTYHWIKCKGGRYRYQKYLQSLSYLAHYLLTNTRTCSSPV